MKFTAAIVGGVCALAALSPASALAAGSHAAKSKPKTHHKGSAKKKHKKAKKPAVQYYLALGDSLARGAQPNAQGVTVAGNMGYANDIYALEQKRPKKYGTLKLEQLGCLGETTGSMLGTAKSPCTYAAGNQLAQAVKFIKSHKIAFITLDIGANDIDSCVSPTGGLNGTCLAQGSTAIGTDVPKIAAALRTAAGKKTPIIGMTYYDPFLAEYLDTSSTYGGPPLAEASVPLAKQINGTLSTDFAAQNIKVADVATAFGTYLPFTQTQTIPAFGAVPAPVADICAFTWMCAPAPQGPNIHATTTGYTVIAKTFEGEL